MIYTHLSFYLYPIFVGTIQERFSFKLGKKPIYSTAVKRTRFSTCQVYALSLRRNKVKSFNFQFQKSSSELNMQSICQFFFDMNKKNVFEDPIKAGKIFGIFRHLLQITQRKLSVYILVSDRYCIIIRLLYSFLRHHLSAHKMKREESGSKKKLLSFFKAKE